MPGVHLHTESYPRVIGSPKRHANNTRWKQVLRAVVHCWFCLLIGRVDSKKYIHCGHFILGDEANMQMRRQRKHKKSQTKTTFVFVKTFHLFIIKLHSKVVREIFIYIRE